MSKTVQQKIKKFRRKRIWPEIISFLITAFIAGMIVMVAMMFFVAYISELKFEQQMENVDRYGGMAQKAAGNGQSHDSILQYLSSQEGMQEGMCIVDKDNVIVASYGDSKFFVNDELKELKVGDRLGEEEELTLLHDYCVYFGEEKFESDYDFAKLFYRVFSEEYGEDDIRNLASDEVVLPIAIWLEATPKIGSDRLFVKETLKLTINDFVFPMIMLVTIGMVIMLLLIVQLIKSIVNIQSQQHLSKALFMDTVTGGNNWLYFSNQAEKIVKKMRNANKTYAVVDFTMMKYRSYCTLHGVQEGEHLLEHLNYYLNRCKQRGELFARYGKSSFAFLLQVKNGEEGYLALQQRLEEMMLGAPHAVAHRHGKSNESKIEENDCASLIFHAGIALIEPSKNEGTNRIQRRRKVDISQMYNNAGIARNTIGEDEGNKSVFFNQQMWETQVWEHKVEESMKEALRREEFQVYVQPKFNPVTEELAGAEALVRWISPTEGFISPGRFIPIFEKTGFVMQLDDYMISHVAKMQAQWLAEGKKIVPISVNVSRAHFAQPDLAEHIRDLVDAYQVPHKYVEIELTESAFFDDKAALLSTVLRLQEYGFDVSMDDFGSGYSSLNSLKDLPLNVLKLDAEFFRGKSADEERGEIVVARAIALAKQLDMRIVAEGVEKKEQVDFLAKQDCDMIQGFYFAKPMPANEYESYLK